MLIKILGLVPAITFLVLAILMESPGPAGAIAENRYTLPFYSNYEITCAYGVPYRTGCGVDLPGNHQGIDYNLGINSTNGEVVAAAAGGTAKGCPQDFLPAGLS